MYCFSANLWYFWTPGYPPLCGRHIWMPLVQTSKYLTKYLEKINTFTTLFNPSQQASKCGLPLIHLGRGVTWTWTSIPETRWESSAERSGWHQSCLGLFFGSFWSLFGAGCITLWINYACSVAHPLVCQMSIYFPLRVLRTCSITLSSCSIGPTASQISKKKIN